MNTDLEAVRRYLTSRAQSEEGDPALNTALSCCNRYIESLPRVFTGAQTVEGIDVPFELRSVEFQVAQEWDAKKGLITKKPSGMVVVELRQMIEFMHVPEGQRQEWRTHYERVSFEALQRRKAAMYPEPKPEIEADGE